MTSNIEVGQIGFETDPQGNPILFGPNHPVLPERQQKLQRIISISEIERIIYRESDQPERQGIFDANREVGIAIDAFLVPARLIYSERGKYCFPPDGEWDLKNAFSGFYPTGWKFGEILALLEKYRPSFWADANPLDPRHPHLEKRNIKERLFPLWQEIARNFHLDSLELQSTMLQEQGLLLASEQTASRETILQIGQRIVGRRFYDLIRDDPDYSYTAKPDCLVEFEMDGKNYYILVQPDYIKRQRDKEATKERRIVAQRIVGDFKDSQKLNFDIETPYGKTMLVYNWLLLQIGQKFRQKPQLRTLANGQKRRVILIPSAVKNLLSQEKVQTALEFLQEGPGQIFYPLPTLTPDAETQAKNILGDAIRSSQKPKFS